MRFAILALAVVAAACGQPAPAEAPDSTQDASAGSSGVGRIESVPFTLESAALVGLWSFDRTCGLYDLVFAAPGAVEYYDYSNEGQVVSYAGTWAAADNNSVVLTLRRRDVNNAPTGDTLSYNLDVSDPVTDDLIGQFGPASGGEPLNITAKRCAEEDRD